VSGATDAARAAASIVLMKPGLSVIIDAVKESRRIVQRMNSYAIYRIAETLRVLLFVTLAILIFNFFPVTAIMIVVLALLNDGSILSIAYDKPATATRRHRRLSQADDARQTRPAQPVHQHPRPGPARNPQLDLGRRRGMTAGEVLATARALVAGDKGLLAMDESNPTCDKRFARAGIAQTEEARRAYRELIVTTAGLGECISDAILYDETIRQRTRDGTRPTSSTRCPRPKGSASSRSNAS